MKEQRQDVGATAFDYPNGQNPRPHFKAFYGDMSLPRPTNSAAKVTHASEVMRATIEGK